MRHALATAAALLLGSASALAQAGFDPVIEDLRRQGYGGFEIVREADRVRIEALRGSEERTLVYDLRTGSLISDESGRRSGGDDDGDDRGGDDDRGRDDGDDDRGGDDDGDDG